jgi:hypothetical protein
MQARPATSPTSWDYQAAIHGRAAAQDRPGWNQCQHGGWFFLPWHRWYLYFFEAIVRDIVTSQGGPADWALPYWDYDGGGDSNRLPQPFREPSLPDGSPNPLFVAQRNPGMNDGTEGVPAVIRSPAGAMAQQLFSPARVPGFGMVRPAFGGDVTMFQHFWDEPGALEMTPHNDLHGFLGAGGPMSDPNRAALDPIFWLHHANIDRLWAHWTGAAPTVAWWLDQTFDFFDAAGAQVSRRNGDAVDIASQLDYTYDDLPAPGPAGFAGGVVGTTPGAGADGGGGASMVPEMIGSTDRTLTLTGGPATTTVRVDTPPVDATGLAEPRRTYMSVEHLDADAPPGVVYAVYVAPGAGEERTHVGNVSMFGLERVNKLVEGERNVRLVFDVTDVVAGLPGGTAADLDVTFEPVVGEGAAEGAALRLEGTVPEIRVGQVSFFVD